MLKSVLKENVDKPEFPKLMIHRSGTIILATSGNDDAITGTLVRQSKDESYPLGAHRTDWVCFSDFFGIVELISE